MNEIAPAPIMTKAQRFVMNADEIVVVAPNTCTWVGIMIFQSTNPMRNIARPVQPSRDNHPRACTSYTSALALELKLWTLISRTHACVNATNVGSHTVRYVCVKIV